MPYNLLQDKNGALQALVKETGHATAENLRQISKLVRFNRILICLFIFITFNI